MLQHLMTPALTPAAASQVDFSGKWNNQHRSEMMLTVKRERVTGTYRTGVGLPQPTEEFDLVGFCSGDLIAFAVNFGKYGSLTSWAGQLTLQDGVERIETLWHLAKNVADQDEPGQLWAAVLDGADTFFRGPHV